MGDSNYNRSISSNPGPRRVTRALRGNAAQQQQQAAAYATAATTTTRNNNNLDIYNNYNSFDAVTTAASLGTSSYLGDGSGVDIGIGGGGIGNASYIPMEWSTEAVVGGGTTGTKTMKSPRVLKQQKQHQKPTRTRRKWVCIKRPLLSNTGKKLFLTNAWVPIDQLTVEEEKEYQYLLPQLTVTTIPVMEPSQQQPSLLSSTKVERSTESTAATAATAATATIVPTQTPVIATTETTEIPTAMEYTANRDITTSSLPLITSTSIPPNLLENSASAAAPAPITTTTTTTTDAVPLSSRSDIPTNATSSTLPPTAELPVESAESNTSKMMIIDGNSKIDGRTTTGAIDDTETSNLNSTNADLKPKSDTINTVSTDIAMKSNDTSNVIPLQDCLDEEANNSLPTPSTDIDVEGGIKCTKNNSGPIPSSNNNNNDSETKVTTTLTATTAPPIHVETRGDGATTDVAMVDNRQHQHPPAGDHESLSVVAFPVYDIDQNDTIGPNQHQHQNEAPIEEPIAKRQRLE